MAGLLVFAVALVVFAPIAAIAALAALAASAIGLVAMLAIQWGTVIAAYAAAQLVSRKHA